MMLNISLIPQAMAQATPVAAQPTMLENMVPILVMVGVFYFFIIRPQIKKQKEQQTFLSGLKKGDAVVTNGGILGIIRDINEKIVSLEIADGVRVKILRSQVAGAYNSSSSESNSKG